MHGSPVPPLKQSRHHAVRWGRLQAVPAYSARLVWLITRRLPSTSLASASEHPVEGECHQYHQPGPPKRRDFGLAREGHITSGGVVDPLDARISADGAHLVGVPAHESIEHAGETGRQHGAVDD